MIKFCIQKVLGLFKSECVHTDIVYKKDKEEEKISHTQTERKIFKTYFAPF